MKGLGITAISSVSMSESLIFSYQSSRLVALTGTVYTGGASVAYIAIVTMVLPPGLRLNKHHCTLSCIVNS